MTLCILCFVAGLIVATVFWGVWLGLSASKPEEPSEPVVRHIHGQAPTVIKPQPKESEKCIPPEAPTN